jgi:hypothetical protein
MSERYIPEHRRNFKAKQNFKPDELRRRREEAQVEIRKQKREESMAKRRNMTAGSPAPGAADSDDEGATDSQVCLSHAASLSVFHPIERWRTRMPLYSHGLSSNTNRQRFMFVCFFRQADAVLHPPIWWSCRTPLFLERFANEVAA